MRKRKMFEEEIDVYSEVGAKRKTKRERRERRRERKKQSKKE